MPPLPASPLLTLPYFASLPPLLPLPSCSSTHPFSPPSVRLALPGFPPLPPPLTHRTGRFGFIRCLSSDEKLFWHSSGSAACTNQNDLQEGREVSFQMRRRGGLRCAVNIRVRACISTKWWLFVVDLLFIYFLLCCVFDSFYYFASPRSPRTPHPLLLPPTLLSSPSSLSSFSSSPHPPHSRHPPLRRSLVCFNCRFYPPTHCCKKSTYPAK